ncbi:LEAF RUST 10 DISEASE-RESISTANCE LOCUS RECEPTOR-LIKE PROTEIN KINASE-like 2.5 [Chenopodium quinoa]|uniref:non-specific serine/threonine protein kinase n=1 Tax=Chenopodium quinoa TaxID=63459 RepID=A0A803KNI5_CHEQI|nr:LEAF RUST 10 DISEASE-RESISTANCE LOCUS RECEPTOR-LIKE PROTEIN KINASE-like 2.5 [Chenopodium quinoa]
MISNGFISIQFPFITCIFLLLAVVPLSNSQSPLYAACSLSYSCGRILNVGYPFWGDNRPSFCGVPEFKLSCNNDSSFPTMKISSSILQVLDINTSLHTITISSSNLYNKCYLQDTSSSAILPTLKLSQNIDYRNISLFYGCNSSCDSRNDSKTFSCSNDDGVNGTAYYFDNASGISSFNNSSCSCNYSATFYVDNKAVYELSRSTDASLRSVLNKWSIVKWNYMANVAACSKCEESGGRCGSSEEFFSDQLVCYCRDGRRALICSEPGGRRNLILGSGVAASVLGMMMVVALVIIAKKRRKTSKFSFLWSRRTIGNQNVAAFLQSYGSLAPKRYTYADIKKITNSFKDKLGEGGYGSVYKGRLHNGRFVAVKKLKVLKGDGKDFINEILSISRTNHVNVVTLLGFCFEGNRRALVFEFLPNGSLEKFIYGKEIRQSLQWETILSIAIGISRGLDYLHRGCNTRILHFDIKPHNILLDDEFHPKISDFGLAQLCPPKKSMISMSEARGTIGYIAPEVFCRNFGGISHKSDVYSYGMMLIDLVCGRKIPTNEVQHDNSELYFPEWIYSRFEPVHEAAVDGIEDNDKNELERKMILVSLWCIQAYPSNRPPMNRVVEMLEGPFEVLQMPPKPHSSSPARCVFDASLMSTT